MSAGTQVRQTAWCPKHSRMSLIEALHDLDAGWDWDHVVATVRLRCGHNVRVIGTADTLPDFYTEVQSRHRGKVKVVNDD